MKARITALFVVAVAALSLAATAFADVERPAANAGWTSYNPGAAGWTSYRAGSHPDPSKSYGSSWSGLHRSGSSWSSLHPRDAYTVKGW